MVPSGVPLPRIPVMTLMCPYRRPSPVSSPGSSMVHDPSAKTTVTSFTPSRAADCISMMLKPAAPSPVVQMTSRSGFASLAPKAEGMGLVLWLLPGAAMLLVGAWMVARVWRNDRGRAAPPPAAAARTAWQRHQLEQDRRRFEQGEEDDA